MSKLLSECIHETTWHISQRRLATLSVRRGGVMKGEEVPAQSLIHALPRIETVEHLYVSRLSRAHITVSGSDLSRGSGSDALRCHIAHAAGAGYQRGRGWVFLHKVHSEVLLRAPEAAWQDIGREENR